MIAKDMFTKQEVQTYCNQEWSHGEGCERPTLEGRVLEEGLPTLWTSAWGQSSLHVQRHVYTKEFRNKASLDSGGK